MKLSRWIVAAAAVLGLAACSASNGEPTPGPVSMTEASPPSSTPTMTTPAATTPASEPTPSTGDSSPTPTPTGVGDSERWAATVPAFEEYWDVINETYAADGAPAATERMKETMTSQQLEFWEKSFADWARQERQYEGENVVTSASVDNVVLSPDSGHAEIRYCVDMSATRAYEANGDLLTKDGNYQSGMALLEWVDGHWKVAGFTPESGVVDSC